MKVFAAIAATKISPPVAGYVSMTASIAATATVPVDADSISWTGMRRTPTDRSEDHTPQRDAVGIPAQHPPKKQPGRPIDIPQAALAR